MIKVPKTIYRRLYVLFFLCPLVFKAQQTLSTDELFLQARSAAFDQKNYAEATRLANAALEKSPDYTEIAVFLGRLYTWQDDLNAARTVFESLRLKNVQNEDFYIAYSSLEYWNDQNNKALQLLDEGLQFNKDSAALLSLKVKVLKSMGKYQEALRTNQVLLNQDPKNTEALATAVNLNDLNSKNAVGFSYGFTHFDKQFDDDWHFVGVSYKRSTKIGSVIFKGNYARKFASDGTQIEIEAYPRISKLFYLYLGAGYSGNVGIFPKYRTGASLNANLPAGFEAEVGYRHLYFSDNIFLYTAAVGKYYKNYWFNLRTYITPDDKSVSHSYTATVRYYIGGAEDYLAFRIGTGISPEELQNSLLETENYKLKTFKIGADYNFSYRTRNAFSISATYFNQEYKPGSTGNQIDVSIGYARKF